MKTSPSIAALSKALVEAQAEMPTIAFDSTNPFLHNRYASLGAVIEASRPVLAKHGLAVTQFPVSEGDQMGVDTMLLHASGEWICERVSIHLGEEKGKSRAQVAGSVTTYLKRYSWASVLGLYADEDNDGNAPVRKQTPQEERPARPAAQAQAPTPAPARTTAKPSTPPAEAHKAATPETRAWMIKKLDEGGIMDSALGFMQAVGWLLPGEAITDLKLRFVPTSTVQFNRLADCVVDFSNGLPAEAPYPPDSSASINDAPPKAAAPTEGQEEWDKPDAPWRAFVVPFGKNAGTKMAEIPKNALFGFFANFKVETQWNGKPVNPDKIKKDTEFRAMLDQAGRHYNFKMPDDVVP